jgi:leader peptidase (prepilin peptidase)/N-methyltransferase
MAISGQLRMHAPATVLLATTGALAASPVLASWTTSLVGDERERWWRIRRVSVVRWLVVTILATLFAALGAHGVPAAAWWLLAVTGAVLAIVDAETYRLPQRIVGPLAAAELVALVATALVLNEPQRLLRALLAAGVVTGVYLLVAIISPPALGIGDAYLAGITAGLLGWSGWTHVLIGQLLIWLLGPVAMAVVALARPAGRGWKMHVPMGPALLAGALLACWL